MANAMAEGRLQIHHRFESRYFSNRHKVIVYLPPKYEEEIADYPVLYMQDGQNLFDPATAFGGRDWQAADTADEAISRRKASPMIIVGVYNAGVRRVSEYTPTRQRGKGGKGDRYAAMLVNELKPFIDFEYRAQRKDTGVGGSSLGALAALQAGLLYSHIFRRLAILSPSVWWDNGAILKIVGKSRLRNRARLWLDAGTAEGENGQAVIDDVRKLRAELLEKGWNEEDNLHYEEIAGAGHDEGAWGARFGRVLEYLYPYTEPGSSSVVQTPSKLTK